MDIAARPLGNQLIALPFAAYERAERGVSETGDEDHETEGLVCLGPRKFSSRVMPPITTSRLFAIHRLYGCRCTMSLTMPIGASTAKATTCQRSER